MSIVYYPIKRIQLYIVTKSKNLTLFPVQRDRSLTQDHRVAHPAGKHFGSGIPSPTTLHQRDTSVTHLPCSQTLRIRPGRRPPPGQHLAHPPLKTLVRATQPTAMVLPQQARALARPGRGTRSLSAKKPAWQPRAREGAGGRAKGENGEKRDFRSNHFNNNQLQSGITETLRAADAGKVHFLSAV